MPGSCGCANQTNIGGSNFVGSTDYTHIRIAPMIVDDKLFFDDEVFIKTKTTTIPEISNRIGMIFNTKAYKITSSQGTDIKKQIKFNQVEIYKNSDNNITTNIPLVNFGIFNKTRLRCNKQQDPETTYGKFFSQERYLMKRKTANFKCENKGFIC